MSAKIKESVFNYFNYTLFIIFVFLCIYPFYYLFLVSISDPDAVAGGRVVFGPVEPSFFYYARILSLKGIFQAFLISVLRSVTGTFTTVLISSVFAYTLTKKELPARKFMYRGMVFTMYASAGLIPWFITMKYLGLSNNFLLYVLPFAISPFAVILIKTYMEQISPFLEESAMIDGAGYFTIYLKIILPVSKPVIAAIAVFSAVGQWNAWQDNFFLVRDSRLQTMQMILMKYLREAESLASALMKGDMSALETAAKAPPSPFTIKTAIAVITIIPIIVVYPLLQRYFVHGIMVGAIKG